jgi:Tfp pilus assembly protein PilF
MSSFSFSGSFGLPARSGVITSPSLSPAQQALESATEGDAALGRGDWEAARRAYQSAVRLNPGRASYHLGSAIACWRLGDLEAAGRQLQCAVRIDCGFAVGHSMLGEWYLEQGMPAEALESTARAMELAPMRDDVVQSRAWVLEAAGKLDDAWALVTQLLQRGFRTTSVAKLHARLARFRGQQKPALDLILQLLRAGGLPAVEASNLHLSAADLLDSLGQYDEAFQFAAHGNALRRPAYDPAMQEQFVDRCIRYFTRQQMQSLPKATYRSSAPVFIVGMPRSGTSLVEQILASHPAVHGAGELDYLYRVVKGLIGMLSVPDEEFPECLNSLTVDEANGMAQIYLGPLTVLAPAARRITDKMPLNFIHLGLISMLFPESRVIHCRRNPLDTCLSCFMTPFNNGHDFKYDLTHLGLFFRQYERLMDHWKHVLDIPILDVVYEDLISNTEPVSRQLVEFLDLPWDPQCLRFYQTARSTATSSVQQVRQPIYKSSAGRWHRYEKHLGLLKAALGM